MSISKDQSVRNSKATNNEVSDTQSVGIMFLKKTGLVDESFKQNADGLL